MATTKTPIVQYGIENKNIPGDPKGWKMKECGNICHWGDYDRFDDFPRFGETDFEMSNDPRISAIRHFLSDLVNMENVMRSQQGEVVRETAEELVIDCSIEGYKVRLMKLHDVSYRAKDSYKRSTRSKTLERQSDEKMAPVEPPMGRNIENFLMAQRLNSGEAPVMPMHRPTLEKPQGSQNRKEWYRTMRHDSCNTFWVKMNRQERDAIRVKAEQPSPELTPLLAQIQKEDGSHTKDYFWAYQRDELAASDGKIYDEIDTDLLVVLDKDSELLVCKFNGLFQLLFGEYELSKLEDALRKWASLPPLPVPDTARHAVDTFIRATRHPEMDLEKAETLEEIEERQQCVVHYGTWAMKGRRNPDRLWKTTDTRLYRGRPRAEVEDFPGLLMHTFLENVLGLGSEAVRFLLSTMAPDEYRECCEVYKHVPDLQKVKMSEPTFATLAVLGINSYTQRHVDDNDVDFGLPGLLALGNYEGGNLCFPQLGIQMPHRRGDTAIFRGSELEHFVRDWSGYRVFLLFTNHQPVRNYAHRAMGKLPPKPNDPWHPDRLKEEQEGRKPKRVPQSDPESGVYSPCFVDPLSPEPEELWETDIHGPGFIGRYSEPSASRSDSNRSDYDRGRLVVALPHSQSPPAKRARLEDPEA
ncbi:hypothetical protein F4778DRAFT_181082 [Xylariomycetidae sp. FL2044]|nr:hypothetical protein F4778DRAFT_181082 [Xylariomycetidae sp. FL2044]